MVTDSCATIQNMQFPTAESTELQASSPQIKNTASISLEVKEIIINIVPSVEKISVYFDLNINIEFKDRNGLFYSELDEISVDIKNSNLSPNVFSCNSGTLSFSFYFKIPGFNMINVSVKGYTKSITIETLQSYLKFELITKVIFN